MRRRALRAAPRAAFAVTAIRLQSFTPSRLRRCALRLPPGDRPKAHPRRALLGAPANPPNRLAPDRPGQRPAVMLRARRIRRSWLRQVVRMRAVLDADGSCPSRHEGWFTDTPPGIAMQLPRHGSRPAPQSAAGAFSPVVGRLTWPASGHEPEKPSCGDAEPAMSPFGCGSAQGVLVSL